MSERDHLEEILRVQDEESRHDPTIRSFEELNQGLSLARQDRARSTSHPEELRMFWASNPHAPNVRRAVLRNPNAPEDLIQRAWQQAKAELGGRKPLRVTHSVLWFVPSDLASRADLPASILQEMIEIDPESYAEPIPLRAMKLALATERADLTRSQRASFIRQGVRSDASVIAALRAEREGRLPHRARSDLQFALWSSGRARSALVGALELQPHSIAGIRRRPHNHRFPAQEFKSSPEALELALELISEWGKAGAAELARAIQISATSSR